MNDFRGAHAIVTGGSSGIGLATATLLASRGAVVSLVARGRERLDDAAAALRAGGATVDVAAVDVADREALTVTLAGLVSAHGPCDVLVTSAGIAHPGRFEQLDDDRFREQMEINYFGTLHALRAVVPAMIERRRGSVVGISSAAGLVGIFGYTAYTPTKFAVRGLFESLRCELKPYGIHVGCAFPPDVDTPQLAYEDRFKPDETRAISGAIKPLTPQRVAATIVRGIEKERFWIVPDVQTRLLARVAGPARGLLGASFDRKVERVRARRDA